MYPGPGGGVGADVTVHCSLARPFFGVPQAVTTVWSSGTVQVFELPPPSFWKPKLPESLDPAQQY
jgi:hypothetical protein